jgi:hypothetical protein
LSPLISMAAEKVLLSEGEFERSCIMLLRQLEASLQGSRRALLALDLAGLERGTREQAGLVGQFEPLRRRHKGYRTIVEPPNPSELQAELQRCAHRVREATRLQAALLARAQAKLRVLGNMLAGPSASYEHSYESALRRGAKLRVLERMQVREI